MTESISNCPLCGGTANRPLIIARFVASWLANRICTSCGCVFHPMMQTEL
jgi:hypothetical protein